MNNEIFMRLLEKAPADTWTQAILYVEGLPRPVPVEKSMNQVNWFIRNGTLIIPIGTIPTPFEGAPEGMTSDFTMMVPVSDIKRADFYKHHALVSVPTIVSPEGEAVSSGKLVSI